MKKMKDVLKYEPYQTISLPDRTWPDQRITQAPIWCSVDLRDGNQALEVPMNQAQKLKLYQTLIDIGFKTIEIGFPAASDTEYAFTRHLIEEDLIPDGVAIQVLTQSRAHIIDKTFEALRGCKKAVVHLYNSTSWLQRDVVFRMDRDQCIALAVSGAEAILKKAAADTSGTAYTFEYSPESFTGTEIDFAVEICDAVCDVWQPTPDNKAIINLPATVELSTPNVYADLIETFCRKTRYRDAIVISLHTHNDRGTAVAATELALMAGADRVEGTLFGNGERTGNADLVALALNLYSQGIDPGLDLSNINDIIDVYEEATLMTVHERHPYAGKLVYTAFSGSHQDAINKGLSALTRQAGYWRVPYLPIDPKDVGRAYEPIIRINSQSGKGGIAFIMQQHFGMALPKYLQQAFSRVVKAASDTGNQELFPQDLYDLFDQTYINQTAPLKLVRYQEQMVDDQTVQLQADLLYRGQPLSVAGAGNGLLDAFCSSLRSHFQTKLEITAYHQHALERGSTSKAISYVQLQNGHTRVYIGAGVSSSISKASLRAVVSAANALLKEAAV